MYYLFIKIYITLSLLQTMSNVKKKTNTIYLYVSGNLS